MRPIVTAAVLIAVIAAPAAACPWWGRSCPPRPVVVYPDCPPPVIYYYPQCPAPVVRVVEAKPAEPARDPNDAPDGWCHIRGRVVYDGDPLPVRKPIPNSNGAYTENWVVNPTNRGVQNVVVWLAPEPTKEVWERLRSRGSDRLREFPNFKPEQVYPGLTKPKDRTVLIPERPIQFIPHMVAVRAGTTVVFKNVSTRLEDVQWTSQNNGQFSPLVPPNGREFEMKDAKAERFPIEIRSSIYPWMRAYVRVFDHPYFAVTSADGEFEIKYAPTGDLRLFVWQESTGYRTGAEGRFGEPIRVPDGRLDLGEIKLKPRP